MKKLLITLLVLFALNNMAAGQYVNIPDNNFALFLTNLYPNCMNGNLLDTTCFDILNEETLIPIIIIN